MKLKNLNPIGCYLIADDQVWKITGFFDNAIHECVEYSCEREGGSGSIETKTVYEDYQENLTLFPTWEKAELCRLNRRLDKLQSYVIDFSDTFDDVREVYRLY